MAEPSAQEFACVDPDVGDRVFELERGDLDEPARRILEAHLDVCDHCKSIVDLDRRLADLVRDDGRVTRRRTLRRARVSLMAAASVVAAACLACLVLLPPRPVGPSQVLRGGTDAAFVRPVEGEVVAGAELGVRWTPIEGVESYRVQITRLSDGATVTERSESEQLRISGSDTLVEGDSYRLLLSTIPEDVVRPGEVSVTFRVGSKSDLITHRIRNAPFVVGLLGVLTLVLALATIPLHRITRSGRLRP